MNRYKTVWMLMSIRSCFVNICRFIDFLLHNQVFLTVSSYIGAKI